MRPDIKLDVHFLMGVGIVEFKIFCIKLCLGTVSNALLMSMARSSVLWLGCSFKPFIIGCIILVRAVVVEWFCLYPCWKVGLGRCGEIKLRISFSRSLQSVDKRDM